MTTTKLNFSTISAISLLAVALAGTSELHAQDHGHAPPPSRRVAPHQHLDTRFSANHAYYDRGYAVRQLPHSGYAIERGGQRYWYDGGHWYGRSGRGWVVICAPLGVFVSVLPPFYTTVWFGGVPHYYANDTYYAWHGDQQEYEVVAPPAADDSAGTTQSPANDAIFFYPKRGQSAEQQSQDRYECHRSAAAESGFDPTLAGGCVPSDLAADKRDGYLRATATCLEARGYSVR